MERKLNWNKKEASKFISSYKQKGFTEDMSLRVYSARLLGKDPSLVLHGGGNSSVKLKNKNVFGEEIDTICVKGSGWDMGNIEPEGFPVLDLEFLKKFESLKKLSDEEMVKIMRQACLDPESPDPSVETLLHAFLPHKFIDHTHSNTILSIANLPNATALFREIFGDKVAILPWIMPGFKLAKACSSAYKKNENIEGIILLNHGIFSFGESAEESFKIMKNLVSKTELLLKKKKKKKYKQLIKTDVTAEVSSLIYKKISEASNSAVPFIRFVDSENSKVFLQKIEKNLLSGKGVITPDHVIRIKDRWLFLEKYDHKKIKIWENQLEKKLSNYVNEYQDYFNKYSKNKSLKILDKIPRLFFVKGIGLFVAGFNEKELIINTDLAKANMTTQINATELGRFTPLRRNEIFEMEYWSLEQKKLQNSKALKAKTVLITGGAGTIGLACAKTFKDKGYEPIIIDKNKTAVKKAYDDFGFNGYTCNLLDKKSTKKIINFALSDYGTITTLILNSGIAIEGSIDKIRDKELHQSLENNFWAHQNICSEVVKVMKLQKLGGSMIFNITKQVLNQGNNFGAYGISKSAMLSLMRQYAIECGPYGIRSNGVNPDKIRSNLLNSSMVEKRSKSRNISEQEYMQGNLLNKEVLASDVAEAILFLSEAESTTGALLSVDGGNTAAFVR